MLCRTVASGPSCTQTHVDLGYECFVSGHNVVLCLLQGCHLGADPVHNSILEDVEKFRGVELWDRRRQILNLLDHLRTEAARRLRRVDGRQRRHGRLKDLGIGLFVSCLLFVRLHPAASQLAGCLLKPDAPDGSAVAARRGQGRA